MKKTLFYLIITTLVVLQSCKTKETTLDEMLDIANSMVLWQGNFQSSVHTTSGTAKIVTENNKRMLVFENFKTDPGPDLRVYLATAANFNDAKEIGTLKASSGSFSYEIDASVNLEQRNHVLIWCKRFSVLFGYTTLAKQ
jgi:Electron transfer DM13